MKKHILPFWGDRKQIDCGSVALARTFGRELVTVIGGTTAGDTGLPRHTGLPRSTQRGKQSMLRPCS